jgi:oligopeptide transport system substrate-binding protein
MLRLGVPFLLLLALTVVAVTSDRPLPRADFTFVNAGEVTTLDPQRQSWMQDLRMTHLLFEGLVKNDVFTWGFDITPATAERWEVSQDQLTYTFHIRQGARWSNGTPVRAQDFVYSWRRALLPDTAAKYTGLFQLIRGGPEFFRWRTEALQRFAAGESEARTADELWEQTLGAFDEMVGLRALDDRTLEVELSIPVPYFLDLCAFGVFSPVYPPLVSRYERPDPKTGRIVSRRGWTKPPLLVGNGPFELTIWRFKRDMRLEKNPHYWNAPGINIDSINMPSIEDQNAQVLAFNTGALDWVADVAVQYRPEILAQKLQFYKEHEEEYLALKAQGLDQFEIDRRLPDDPRKYIHAVPAFATYWYNFNCLPLLRDGRPNPFADPRVRRAFAMAIDKQGLVDTVVRLGNPVAHTIVPPGSIAGYTSPRGVGHDPAAARRLLAEAGYPPGAFPITVEILFNKDSSHDKIAEFIGRNWEDNLGVSVQLMQREIKIFRDDLVNANFITSRAGWYGDYGDPTTFLDLNRSWDGNNDRKYNNPAYDALLADASRELDPDKRMRLLEEAERIIMDEDLPMVPLFHYVSLSMFNPHRVSGITSHPRYDQQLQLIDILTDKKGSNIPRVLPPRPPSDDARPAFERRGPAAHLHGVSR